MKKHHSRTHNFISKSCSLSAIVGAALGLICRPGQAEEPLPNVERLKSSPVLRHLKPNPMTAPPRTAAEQTVAQMYLPEGFRAELVVAEPDLHQPIAFAWDERGRMWVAEAYSYPAKRPAGQGLDKIVIFEDRDGDGKFETRKVFAEGLNLVSGLEVGYGGVWVGAAPELLFIPDRNHDDVPDGPPQVLLDGFGFQDTHECLNSFLWGPDGWLYGNQGVFNYARIGKPGTPDSQRTELRAGVWRYHPVRHEFEVFAHGGSNPWGLDYDERGQLFMTHCRSYWGRGCTTHVIQGGHFWNQANANHAPFIIANPPADFPGFRNYLLASARYDHGAGGAGPPGSDAIYGGHSHVGTMIYLGDNWPDEFRGHLFTHNLGGHQINQQINRRAGSGFDTVHGGRDQFFCSDPKYVAVDLQYGPDGAVYVIDWYDQQHCHNPNVERWDRSNGRIYRIQYDATFQPRKVDLASLDDTKLAGLHGHKNEWQVRTARRLLHERSLARPIESRAKTTLLEMAQRHNDPVHRLRALWTLHAIGLFSDDVAKRALADRDEFVRGWGIQLATDNASPRSAGFQPAVSPAFSRQGATGPSASESQPASAGSKPAIQQSATLRYTDALLAEFVRLAKSDPSPVVRLYLASVIQRLPAETAWPLIESLAQHAEDRDDRNLPLLLWQGLARRMPENLDRAFAVAQRTTIPQLPDFIYWYAATFEKDALNRAVAVIAPAQGETLRRRLAGLWLAMEPRANVSMPAAWKSIAPALYANEDGRVRRVAERLAAVFGDDSMFPRLRETLADGKVELAARQHAFAVLNRAQDRASLPVFLRLLDDAAFRSPAINALGRFEKPEIAEALISRFDRFTAAERSSTLNTLTSRAGYAVALLDALAAGRIKRDQLTALHVRQLTDLHNAGVDQRVATTWGRILQTPAEKQTLITRLEKDFNEAPLWAYSGGDGQKHFQKLCAQCHRVGEEGARLGPELTGAGKNGIRYYLENIIDPNAVIGADFQMTILETKGGDVLSGLIAGESPTAVMLRTTAGDSIIAKADLVKRTTSEKSLMPEGILEALSDRERLELLKFLITH